MRPSLGPLAWVFARFGNTVYGGGSATIAVLEREIVDRRAWLDRRRTHLMFAVSRLTPGTNLLAFCTGVGWLLRRGPGAVVALAAASVPCSILAVVLTMFYRAWADQPLAGLALRGALASAVAIMVATCWTIVRPCWRPASRFRVVLVFAAAFTLGVVWGVPPIRVLALSAALGALWPEAEAR